MVMSKIELNQEYIEKIREVDYYLADLEYVEFGEEKIWYLNSPQSNEYFELKGILNDSKTFLIEFSEDKLLTITSKAIDEKIIEDYEKYLLDYLISHMTDKGLI
jgi:hypothetical protein